MRARLAFIARQPVACGRPHVGAGPPDPQTSKPPNRRTTWDHRTVGSAPAGQTHSRVGAPAGPRRCRCPPRHGNTGAKTCARKPQAHSRALRAASRPPRVRPCPPRADAPRGRRPAGRPRTRASRMLTRSPRARGKSVVARRGARPRRMSIPNATCARNGYHVTCAVPSAASRCSLWAACRFAVRLRDAAYGESFCAYWRRARTLLSCVPWKGRTRCARSGVSHQALRTRIDP